MEVQISFPNKMVSYETFVRDLGTQMALVNRELDENPREVTQRQAYQSFGRDRVDRWRKHGLIETTSRGNRVMYPYARLVQLRNQS